MTQELLAILLALALQHPTMPAGMSHEEHLKQLQKDEELNRRGALAMGFDQQKTRHRFTASRSGGTIAVDANDAADAESLAAIRSHLQEIARAFAAGDFAKPLQTHGEMPPGAEDMQ